MKHKSYQERVADNLIFNCSGPDIESPYLSSINSCTFFGLNHKFKDAPNFSATRIDEHYAFTLNLHNVAVIPRELFLELESLLSAPRATSISRLIDVYRKYKLMNEGELI